MLTWTPGGALGWYTGVQVKRRALTGAIYQAFEIYGEKVTTRTIDFND